MHIICCCSRDYEFIQWRIICSLALLVATIVNFLTASLPLHCFHLTGNNNIPSLIKWSASFDNILFSLFDEPV